MEVAYFLPFANQPNSISVHYPEGLEFSTETEKALQQAWQDKKSTGIGTPGGLIIDVRDTGFGIPDDKHHQVFDKYSRLKLEDSKIAGTGLGLAISRSIMESQLGTINVANHSEGGAVFSLFFPLYAS